MLLAITGNPVLHSRSPELHMAILEKLGITEGAAIRIGAVTFTEALIIAKELGVSGINVTAPFKEAATVEVDLIESEAAKLAAVNTVRINTTHRTFGFNTDCAGIVGALQEWQRQLSGQLGIILGAGGAARAAVLAYRKMGVRPVIVNRTLKKAAEIGSAMGVEYCHIESKDLRSIFSEAKVIISTLPIRERVIAPELFNKQHIVLDGVYAYKTAITSDAMNCGATVASGEKWLLHQGIESVYHFCGRRAVLNAVKLTASNPKKIIALSGFMGCGKSSFGAVIASKLGYNFIDLDREVESRAGCSISGIFSKYGESYFRALETALLVEIFASQHGNVVLALGGGTVLAAANQALLREHATTVWLYASLETTLNRLRVAESIRPLVGSDDNVRNLFRERLPMYIASADLVIASDEKLLGIHHEKLSSYVATLIETNI